MHIASAVLVLFSNLFLHRLLLHFVDVCARVSPFFSHPLCLSLLILFGFPPPSFPFIPSFSLPVCVCSLPQSTSISQSSCFLSPSPHHPRSPPSPLPSTQSPSSTTACQTFPKTTTSSATRPLHTHCGPSPWSPPLLSLISSRSISNTSHKTLWPLAQSQAPKHAVQSFWDLRRVAWLKPEQQLEDKIGGAGSLWGVWLNVLLSSCVFSPFWERMGAGVCPQGCFQD